MTLCAIMSIPCCLCRRYLDDNHRKRKKFHGRSCDTARLVICSISSGALNSTELRDPNAMLCLSCDKLLKDLKATEAKLSTLRQQVTEILQGMHADSLASKRPRIDRDTQAAANENQDETATEC